MPLYDVTMIRRYRGRVVVVEGELIYREDTGWFMDSYNTGPLPILDLEGVLPLECSERAVTYIGRLSESEPFVLEWTRTLSEGVLNGIYSSDSELKCGYVFGSGFRWEPPSIDFYG